MRFGESEGYHVADVVTDHVRLTNMDRIEDASDVFGLVFLRKAVRLCEGDANRVSLGH